MGMGDVLMSIGRAQKMARESDEAIKPRIVGVDGRMIEHPLIDLDADDREDEYLHNGFIVDGPGARPYIQFVTVGRFHWRDYEPYPAKLVVSKAADDYGRQFADHVVIGRYAKPDVVTVNKEWLRGHWSILLSRIKSPIIMPVQEGTKVAEDDLERAVVAPSIEYLVAIMKHAKGYVGIEGGLHHLAAAFDKPAVVINGGYIGPNSTGYKLHHHRYLTGGVSLFCGRRFKCAHCYNAMATITPEYVLESMREVGL